MPLFLARSGVCGSLCGGSVSGHAGPSRRVGDWNRLVVFASSLSDELQVTSKAVVTLGQEDLAGDLWFESLVLKETVVEESGHSWNLN